MATPARIEAADLSLVYRLPRDQTRSIQEFAIRLAKRQIRYEDLWALTGVSFSVRPGEVLAVVGPNGAGKSTLMKVVARVLSPTQGRIVVRGRVAPLIELGAGFHHDLTGYENLILYGSILGHHPDDLRAAAGEIAEWAGVTDFMDAPTRTYSSGMLSRLGFSVATWARPEVLLVDEVLSVGDETFRRRSTRRIKEMLGEGTSLLFVSHQMDSIRTLAHKVLWLDGGRAVMYGNTEEVLDAYLTAQDAIEAPITERQAVASQQA